MEWFKKNIETILFYMLGGCLGVITSLFIFMLEASEEADAEIFFWAKGESKIHITVNIIIAFTAGFLFMSFVRARSIIKRQHDEAVVLKEISRNKTELVSSVTHFIRTPISALNNSVSMFLEKEFGPYNKQQEDILVRINSRVQQLIALTRDLLDVEKLEEGRVETDMEKITLEELHKYILSIIDEMNILAKEKNITIQLIGSLDHQRYTSIDRIKIHQILYNIINNSLTYSPFDSTITITIKNDINNFTCSITDKGIGIPQKDQKKVFNKFFRADNAVKKFGAGMGISLYLCNEFIKVHEGKIWFESTENIGTTFNFTIPLIVEKSQEFFEKI